MNTKNLFIGGGVAALVLGLIALPAPTAISQATCPDSSTLARLEQKLAQLQAKLQGRDGEAAKLAELHASLASSQMALAQHRQAVDQREGFRGVVVGDDDGLPGLLDGEDASWLGVELREVTSEVAKNLKLPAERGVVVGSVVPDSPAAKAGLKENDVVTEINGQRIEGVAQFRRMIREIPSGRTVQLSVWRDGRAQIVSATLGKAEERRNSFKMLTPGPGTFAFDMPGNLKIEPMPPNVWAWSDMLGAQPRLGIDAEDLNGQLATFFGAPDGEGILVREVAAGSPAEKAGVKAGDVITSVNGERVRSIGDLREKLAARNEAKDKAQTVKIGVLRNRSEVSLTVELPPPPPAPRFKRLISHRTSI